MAFGKSTKAFSETVPEGIVISSDPKGGSTLRFGTIVDLVVSKGRRPIPVGELGRQERRRRRERRSRSAASRSTSPSSTPTPSPRAWSSRRSPTGGTLFKGDTVSCWSRCGPELVAVPNVVAAGVDDATAALEDAGFDVDVQ